MGNKCYYNIQNSDYYFNHKKQNEVPHWKHFSRQTEHNQDGQQRKYSSSHDKYIQGSCHPAELESRLELMCCLITMHKMSVMLKNKRQAEHHI